MGHTHDPPRRAAPGRERGDYTSARDPVSAFAGNAVLDVHGVPGLRGERRRVQGYGTRRLRPPDDGGSRSQVDSPHAGRRVRAGPGLLRVSDHGRTILFLAFRGLVRTAA